VWLLAVAMGCIGAVDGPAATSKGIWLASVTSAAGRPLESGVGLFTAVERAATTLGPLGAGLLFAASGTRVLWPIALLFAAAALISACNHGRQPRRTAGNGYGRQLVAGAAFLRGESFLIALLTMYVVTNGLDQLFLIFLFPMWAKQQGRGPALVGLAVGAFGAGAVVTALVAAKIGHRLPAQTVYLIASPIGGVSRLLIVAAGAPPEIVVGVFIIAGLGSGATNVILDAAQLRLIPEVLHGRVRTLIAAGAWLGIPLGSAAVAACAGRLAAFLPGATWICGAVYLIAILYPGWRVTALDCFYDRGSRTTTETATRTYDGCRRCPAGQAADGSRTLMQMQRRRILVRNLCVRAAPG
jgi:predicted MFS family arabinose efflux permease